MLLQVNFNVECLDENEYDLDFIIRGLSKICRWTGQTHPFFSVLNHLRYCDEIYLDIVAKEIEQKFGNADKFSWENVRIETKRNIVNKRLGIISHDFSEAYLNDVNTAVKSCPFMERYVEFEKKFLESIRKCFGIEVDDDINGMVQEVDLKALVGEAKLLLPYEVYKYVSEQQCSDVEEPDAEPTLMGMDESALEFKQRILHLFEQKEELERI